MDSDEWMANVKQIQEENKKMKELLIYLDRCLTDLSEINSKEFRENHKDLFDKLEEKLIKRGRWMAQDPCRGYSETYKCSACEEIVTLNTFTRGCSYEYCPECGAKMDEGEEE